MSNEEYHPDFSGWWGVVHEFKGYKNGVAFTNERRAKDYAAHHHTVAFRLYRLEDLMSSNNANQQQQTDLAVSNKQS